MSVVLVLLAGLFGFLFGVWSMRLTRSDTWRVVQDLHVRVSLLEATIEALPPEATVTNLGDSRGKPSKETELSAL